MNFRLFTLSLIGLFCVITSQLSAQTRDTGREVMRGEMNFTDLANYYSLHPQPLTMKDEENEDDDEARPFTIHPITDSSMIRTRVTSMYAPSAPSISAFLPISPPPNDTFESTIDNNTSIPPDTHGAVDSNYCMTTINTTVHIQTRAGVTISSVSLNAFFSPLVTTGTVYDPRVHYDPFKHRWIFIADYGAEATTSSLLIAISETSNPTGAWYEFKVLVDATGVNWLDFPEVGFNNKWITVSGNMFTVASSAFTATKIFTFNKANLLAGTSATYTAFTEAGSFTMCPTLTYDTTEQSMFLVESWNPGAGAARISKITGAVGAESWAAVGYPVTSQSWQQESNQFTGTGGADFAPQTGSVNKVQTNDDRFDQMIYMNGNLWFAHTIFLPYSTSANATRSSIQWWQTDTIGNPIQTGSIDDATGTNFYAFPSLAVNKSNDVLIGFAAFSAATHPSGAYAVRYHTDPIDSMRPLQIFRHGQNSYYKIYTGTKNRWGDYSGAVMDPLNQTDFWTIQEASAATVNEWDTWWSQIVMCTAPSGITGSTSVCAGSAITLTDATTGGTWSSGSTATATVGSATGVVTGVAAGTVTISFSTGPNCFSASTITVNALPAAISGVAQVCVGSTVTLTDATTGGTWISGTTTVATVGTGAGVVSGVASGTSIISYTLSTGCRVTSTATVNPVPTGIFGSTPLCAGSTITLTDATTGGTWSSGSTTVATVGSVSGIVTGVGPGTSIITYALGTGCTATAIVTVNTTPSGVTGPGSVCAGSTITLNDLTTGGTWTSSTTAAATVIGGTGVVTGVASGTSTISYTLSTGCKVTTVVTVNSLPSAIIGSVPVCAGSTLALTDGGGGTWISGTTTVATVVSGTGNVTGVASGTSIITYTLGTACTATVVVTVNSLPSAITGSVPVCAGSILTLTDAGGGTWVSGNTTVATVVTGSGSVTGVTSGTSIITYSLGTGCATTAVVTVNSLPLAITGSVPVCVGSIVALTDAGGGTWISGTPTVATVISGTGSVTGVVSGTSIITYTLGTGCSTTAVVTVNSLPSAITGSVPVCAGSVVALTDGGGGTWVSGNTAVATVVSGTGAVTGVASGTSIITYALGTGCTTTIVVTINSLPSAITGSVPVCVGSIVALTDAGGGTWVSGNTAVATVVTGSGSVTGVTSGTSIITYSLGTGCATTAVVTVNSLPLAITGSVPVCVSSIVALTDAGGGTWVSGNTAVATVVSATGAVTGVTSGTSIITYSLGTGCTTTIVVTVNSLPSAITGSVPVCVGSIVALTDAGGGTWVSGNTAVATVVSGTGSVTGVTSGTSIITYSLGTGCTTTIVVTVNSLPSAITGSVPVCAGSTLALTDAGGGTWVSGNTAVATVVTGSGSVTGVTSGTSIITYSLGTGCTTTIVVTVNSLPSAITGSVPVCAGSVIALTDGGGGTWVSGNTAVATVVTGSGSVTGVTSGTSIITYSLGTGCTTTIVVTVNSLPSAITGSVPVCVGSIVALTDAGGGTWVSGTTAVATVVAGSGSVTGVTSGTSIITYSLGTGCTITVVVTVNSLPSAITGSVPVCVGSVIALTDGGGGTWISGNTAVATVVTGSGSVTGVTSGTSIITYSLGTGCTATAVVTVNSLPLAITGSVPVCVGSIVALTDAGGGTWISGNTAVATVVTGSGSVTGVTSGTSIITYSLGTGCTTTVVVTVNSLPSAITGSVPVCVGSLVALTDAGGGTWVSGNTAVATVVTGSGSVTGVTSGTSIITYSLGTGCTTTVVVTVNSLPSAITGSVPVCAGSILTLTDAGGGTWVSGNTAVATAVSGTGAVTGVTSGTSIITYTLGTGCTATAVVTVNSLPSAITGPSAVCIGTTTTLSDAGGGTWTSGNTSVATVVSGTGVVTGASSGTSLITYTLASGCSATSTVSVNALPSVISGSVPVCIGSTITLSDGGGGTWVSGNTGVATVIAASGVVTGVSAGTAVITYIIGTGCTATTIVTVNSLPTSITGAATVCAGSTITLTDAGGGTWSSGNTAIATAVAGTGVITGVSFGSAAITYTLSTGCMATKVITVNALPPAITGSFSICAGAPTTLSDAGGGSWSSSNTSAATVASAAGAVTGVASGTSAITYTLGTGCSATTTITVNPLPSAPAGSVPVCAGSAITLGDLTTGGSWTSGNTAVATVITTTGVTSGVTPGTAVLTYTLGTGCTAATVVTVNISPATITGSSIVCTGSTQALTDGITGGAWSSSATGIATIAATGVISGVATGSASITYTLSDGCFVTTSITGDPAPLAITGGTAVCIGNTRSLADGTSGGTWSSLTTSVATVNSTGVVGSVATGSTTITYTLSTGCYITSPITVNPLPAAITGTGTVCTGSTVTIADATSGGTWASSATGTATVNSTGMVSGAASGTATITYTSALGCFVTTTVTDNSLPASISGVATVCMGAVITLTDATTGGTWNSGNTSVATIAAGSGIVTGVASGTTTITYIAATGCAAAKTITVNALPASITGLTNICTSATTTLSDAGGGTWSSDNTAVVSVVAASGAITGGALPGTATITYTLPTGCTTTVIVTVNSVPAAISGPASVCVGASIALSDAGSGTWSSSATTVATVVTGTGVVSGVTPGTASITYSVASGCTASQTITVNALPLAITGTANVCEGSATTLTDATSGGTWMSDNTLVATIAPTAGSVSGITAGTAAISYTASSGCMATRIVTVSALPSAISAITNVVCTGQTINVTDAGGGTWSSSNTSVASVTPSSGLVTGAVHGTATITYTLSTGCKTTIMVTANGLPAAISGTAGVCSGGSITLADITSAGSWSSVSTNVTVDPLSGNVSGITAGSATVTYTVAGCSALKIVSVNPLPVITGTGSVCAGSSVTLSASITGGTWISGSTALATITPATGIVSGSVAGVTTITYTSPTGCTAYTSITVNALPAPITGTLHVCPASSAILTDASTGGTWASLTTTIASIDAVTGALAGIAPGSSNVTYSLGGCIVIATVTVNPAPAAITGTVTVCQGLTTPLTDAGGGTWSSSSTGIATITSGTGIISGILPGTTTITYTLATGCATTAVSTVNITPAAISGLSDVCLGSTITLGDVTTSGSWSSASATVTVDAASGNVTGVASGTAVISYAIGACIAATPITVNPISAITGPASVCTGSIITLTDATGGGSWTSAGTGTATVTATGMITAVSPGTTVITYTLPTGCSAATTITVNPLPATITGVPFICQGATGILADVSTAGMWASSNTSVASVDAATGAFTGVAAGTATIAYSLTTGCSVAATVTVSPLPSPITAIGNVCVGFIVPLSDGGVGTWSSSNTAVIAINSATGIATAISPGSAAITFTLATGCSATVSILSNPQPAAITGADSVCVGGTSVLSDTGSGAWSSSDESVVTVDVASGIVSGVSAGTAIITYTLASGCFTVDSLIAATCRGTGIKQITGLGGNINILPNPNKGEFTISGYLSTITDEEVTLEITDLLGQAVYQNKINALKGKINVRVKLSNTVASGVYILSLHSVTDNRIFHVVVEQ